ncbi:hypothetical protein DPMN_000497 [Dreissena polymorpha]|uniref:Galactosyltransferase C-terminal domain-containing protein n=1 Tax=Dreissena polymorpha TaxID=45954 RepID=A0A9D4MIC8_DREPO|nr:hypothetical protein DPMN_000497 [Dreissena polymorpha]
MNKTVFQLVNGFSNLYLGWGGEDDDMSHRTDQTTAHQTVHTTKRLTVHTMGHTTENTTKLTLDHTIYQKRRASQSHYDAGGAPVRDPGSTGMNRGSIGDDRDEPGKTGASPGKTDNAGAAPGTTGTAPETTGTAPKLHLGPYRTRQSYGNAPVKAVRVLVYLRHGECRRCNGIPGFAGTLSAFTGAQPGHYRRQPGLFRDAAGFHRALPATTGALSGLHRDKP